MELQTMQPNTEWEPAGYEESIAALGADDYTFHVWGGDWCIDCARSNIEHYPVEKEDDGSKTGPGVEEYGIEYIPTVVVEKDGEELTRFVESEDVPIAVYLGKELQAPNE